MKLFHFLSKELTNIYIYISYVYHRRDLEMPGKHLRWVEVPTGLGSVSGQLQTFTDPMNPFARTTGKAMSRLEEIWVSEVEEEITSIVNSECFQETSPRWLGVELFQLMMSIVLLQLKEAFDLLLQVDS